MDQKAKPEEKEEDKDVKDSLNAWKDFVTFELTSGVEQYGQLIENIVITVQSAEDIQNDCLEIVQKVKPDLIIADEPLPNLWLILCKVQFIRINSCAPVRPYARYRGPIEFTGLPSVGADELKRSCLKIRDTAYEKVKPEVD